MSSNGNNEEERMLLCYNRGCGQEYKESENSPTSCKFHPGTPFFHDAYKGWTCCRKSVDFTEFLNMKGCATSYHSNEKPPEPQVKKGDVVIDESPGISQPIYTPIERPSSDTPLVKLPTTLSDSLRKQTYQDCSSLDKEEGVVPEIKIGITACVNKGCVARYSGPEADSEVCKYHPGVPIFHEGLKFWSCCQKRTTEFETFMKQEGCKVGSHVWIKPKENSEDGEGAKIIKCRNDWHQDGSDVILVVYGGGKKFNPSKSLVQANPVKLNIELCFPEENGFYREEWILGGIIDPESSSVLMTPMKIEIKMKKAEPVKWSSLDIPREKLETIINQQKSEECKSVGVEPVDLSDL